MPQTLKMEIKPQLATSNSYEVTYIPQTARPQILSSVSSFLDTLKPSWWSSTLSQENPPPFSSPGNFSSLSLLSVERRTQDAACAA